MPDGSVVSDTGFAGEGRDQWMPPAAGRSEDRGPSSVRGPEARSRSQSQTAVSGPEGSPVPAAPPRHLTTPPADTTGTLDETAARPPLRNRARPADPAGFLPQAVSDPDARSAGADQPRAPASTADDHRERGVVPETVLPAPSPAGQLALGGDRLTARAARPAAAVGATDAVDATDQGEAADHVHLVDRARREPAPRPDSGAGEGLRDLIQQAQRRRSAEAAESEPGQANLVAVHQAAQPAHPPVIIGEIHVHEAAAAPAPADPLGLLAPYAGGLTARRGLWSASTTQAGAW